MCQDLVRCKNRPPKASKRLTPEEREKQRKLVKEQRELLNKLPEDFKPYYEEPISPTKLKVVCDSMLQGLSKKLRLYGVDSVAIGEHFTLQMI